jgi:hypothetical protein
MRNLLLLLLLLLLGRECTLEGDTSSLFYAASALLKLQHMYGLIPRLQVGNMLWGARGLPTRVVPLRES